MEERQSSPDDRFDAFKKQVRKARPDLTFTFKRGECGFGGTYNHEARWTFPGAIGGGSVMWLCGTNELCWGIDSRDGDAWIAFERSCGREPRYT
ncbi:hypothetical protein B1757_02330 [Acidithiobacillus marinus]|uniref:Uncharacterized protein n=1 Tax=Acidithiobacillus marinus TaxID=187490 RepID=A0A2I1DPL0_9PROT|nr:hypothetical protein [Acidithiobacillus marinus]PKY11818.1 hypothetical protein B1757_02330 [Acidithiobacillus marinus]